MFHRQWLVFAKRRIIENKENPSLSAELFWDNVQHSWSSFSEINQTVCRTIPSHVECSNLVDPRLRIHSARLRSKVRQMVMERLSKKSSHDRNEILKEVDHLVECHGRRFYWYRVIRFLQNVSLSNNSPRQMRESLRELSRLLVLTPKIAKLLKIKQKHPKLIPIESPSTENKDISRDPRSRQFSTKLTRMKLIDYGRANSWFVLDRDRWTILLYICRRLVCLPVLSAFNKSFENLFKMRQQTNEPIRSIKSSRKMFAI